MKLNVSLSSLCLALALFFGTAYADGGIVAGTMHKTGSLAVGKEPYRAKMPLQLATRLKQAAIRRLLWVMILPLPV